MPLPASKDLISFVTSLFDDGCDGAETPRQARHSKHPAYGGVIGVSSGLIVTQESKVYPTIDDAVRAAAPAASALTAGKGTEADSAIVPSNGSLRSLCRWVSAAVAGADSHFSRTTLPRITRMLPATAPIIAPPRNAPLAGSPGVVRGKAGQPAVDSVNDLFLTAGAHSW